MKTAYRKVRYLGSQMSSVETVEGESLEEKIERMVNNKEPIKDGAPEIYTERKDGIISAYNIRTDVWEIAADAMDMVSAAKAAKREGIVQKKAQENKDKMADPMSVDKPSGEVGKPESAQGLSSPDSQV